MSLSVLSNGIIIIIIIKSRRRTVYDVEERTVCVSHGFSYTFKKISINHSCMMWKKLILTPLDIKMYDHV